MQISASIPSAREKNPVWLLIILIVFLWASFMAVDWMNYLYGLDNLYPAYAKPLVSMLCAGVVLLALARPLHTRDWRILGGAFACIVVVDICMSIFVYSKDANLKNTVFLIGAGLSIVAHLLLLMRHAQGFHFLRSPLSDTFLYRWGFPLAFYIPVVLIFIALSPYLMAVGQFWPSLLYTLILTTSLWIAWETVRQRLFPRPNAWLIALGVSSWFATELVGVVHNIEIGPISDISMNLTWLFYLPGILLLALSGWQWLDGGQAKPGLHTGSRPRSKRRRK